MEASFKRFINQIPQECMAGIDTHYTSNILIARPAAYVTEEVYMLDYHFTLPSSALPPIRIEGKSYDFGKGRMLVFAPDIRVKCLKDIPTKSYVAMSVKREFLEETARAVTGKAGVPFPRADAPINPALFGLIHDFEQEMARFGCACPLMLQSISTQIAVQLLRGTGCMTDEQRQPVDRHYIDNAEEYIAAYYNTNIRIGDICRHINISPYHFIRMFKDKTGMTPHQYLQQVRMDRAEAMLKKGGYSVEEVSILCGYISPTQFSSCFKRLKGMPPSVFKKKYSFKA